MMKSNSLTEILLNAKKKSIAYDIQGKSIATMVPSSLLVERTASITQGFNYQSNKKIQYLDGYKESYREAVKRKLELWPDYRGDRGKGVGLAWVYERTDIEWGGKGSEKWTRAERHEILRRGTLRGAVGHHQKNVAKHLLEQANPDNIKFYRTKEEHLLEGHHGCFGNESDGPMIDRTKMLEKTNRRRIIKNELKGAGLTAVLAFAITASLTFILELAREGNNPQKVNRALKNAGRDGLEGVAMAVVCYGITRLIMAPAKKGIGSVLSKIGLSASDELLGMGITSAVVIAVTSIWTYVKLRRAGICTRSSLSQVGKQTLSQLGTSVVIIVIQVVFGPTFAILASLAIAFYMLAKSIYQIAKEKKLVEKIRIYTIEHSYPSKNAFA